MKNKILILLIISIVLFIVYLVFDMRKKEIYYFGTDTEKYKRFGVEKFDRNLWNVDISSRKEMLYSYLKEEYYKNDEAYEQIFYYTEDPYIFKTEKPYDFKNTIILGKIDGVYAYLVIDKNNCIQIIPDFRERKKRKYTFYSIYYKRFNNLKCDYISGFPLL